MNQVLIGRQEVSNKEKYDFEYTGVTASDKCKNTDIHWYKFFIGNYNSDECRVGNRYLSFKVNPNFYYNIYYNMLGNLGLYKRLHTNTLKNIALRILFLIFFALEFYFFIDLKQVENQNQYSLAWEYSSEASRIILIIFASIYLIISIPGLIMRHKAIKEVLNNDEILPYLQQYTRMIMVSNDFDRLNAFYQVSISKYQEILTQYGCKTQNTTTVATSLTQIQKGKDVVNFMVYRQKYRDLTDEAHSSLSSRLSFLNYQFYLMPFYQAGIVGFWLLLLVSVRMGYQSTAK